MMCNMNIVYVSPFHVDMIKTKLLQRMEGADFHEGYSCGSFSVDAGDQMCHVVPS